MKKLFAIVAILAALVLAQMSAVMTSIFSNMSDPTIVASLDQTRLIKGDFLQLWFLPVLWQRFFQFSPRAFLLIHGKTLLLVLPLLAALIYFFRFRRAASWAKVSWLCLLAATVPYFVARGMLLNNSQPGVSGTWLVVVLVGQIYAAWACIGCAAIEFVEPLERYLDRRKWGRDEKAVGQTSA